MNNPSKGIPMPKKREIDRSSLFEELEAVKIVDSKVLVMRQVPITSNTVYDNANWRERSYESFKKRMAHISEDYVGGVDWDEINIATPEILPLTEIDGEEYVQVFFRGHVPINISRKELH